MVRLGIAAVRRQRVGELSDGPGSAPLADEDDAAYVCVYGDGGIVVDALPGGFVEVDGTGFGMVGLYDDYVDAACTD